MSDPLGLLPIAIAAGSGRVDGFEAQQLVAAGLTLLQRSAPLVRALHRRRAGILLPTSPAFFTALAASEGRSAVLINPLAAAPEIEYQVADADIGAVFTSADLAKRVPPFVPRVILDELPRTVKVVSDGLARDIDVGSHHGLTLEGDSSAPGSSEDAAIVYTSAMSGVPLGARLTHANLISNARATIEAGAITADDRALAVLPFSHLFGLVVSGVAPLIAGGGVTTMARFHPQRAIEVLESEPISMLVGVPAIFGAMATLLARRRPPLRSRHLRLCICGGAKLSIELQDRWHELTGVELRQGYGLTEAGPVCLFNHVNVPNHRGTLGAAFPGVRVSIRGPDGAELANGSEGEIYVTGPNVFAGYVHADRHVALPDEEWSAGLPRIGEWLRTGDLGVRRPDGSVEFRGLAKPMFTRSGFNIYPREIERVVTAMPGVRSARVRAIPEPARENDIALDVVGEVRAEDVEAWCDARLAAYKRPSEVNVASSR